MSAVGARHRLEPHSQGAVCPRRSARRGQLHGQVTMHELVGELADRPGGHQAPFVEHVEAGGTRRGNGSFRSTRRTVIPAARSRMITSPISCTMLG